MPIARFLERAEIRIKNVRGIMRESNFENALEELHKAKTDIKNAEITLRSLVESSKVKTKVH
ncbi:hypothetical protein phiOC_p336 [Ochrobactrum phage vB_OspM_OC]|nr:hypothetical protein phiOC_p336 [Ochrobactrum phage vB_OspM_OC]